MQTPFHDRLSAFGSMKEYGEWRKLVCAHLLYPRVCSWLYFTIVNFNNLFIYDLFRIYYVHVIVK